MKPHVKTSTHTAPHQVFHHGIKTMKGKPTPPAKDVMRTPHPGNHPILDKK